MYALLHLSPDASDEEVHRVIDNRLKFITLTNIKLHIFYFVSSFSPLFFPSQLSLHDGSINLSNSWTHQLSDKASGNVCLFVFNLNRTCAKSRVIYYGWMENERR
ncbi:hypothetical protein Goklo_024820 [Gossypium klotzschianum]|uniref:Uncharacterized protein n=1 Tax=Gossypium klotzschianum TaxID=34286 RepID=A0A7J8WBM2_9ROSI|nr:hypothetical protein [Gossypium klotzschianum]